MKFGHIICSKVISNSCLQERDIQSREMLILKKTIEELEIRIDSQKQTLEARDESIKKLLEMLHSKGVNITKVSVCICKFLKTFFH